MPRRTWLWKSSVLRAFDLLSQLLRPPNRIPSDMRQSQKPGIISPVWPTRPAAAIFETNLLRDIPMNNARVHTGAIAALALFATAPALAASFTIPPDSTSSQPWVAGRPA
jgi:hypothetical protein